MIFEIKVVTDIHLWINPNIVTEIHPQKYFWTTWGDSPTKALGACNLDAFEDASPESRVTVTFHRGEVASHGMSKVIPLNF